MLDIEFSSFIDTRIKEAVGLLVNVLILGVALMVVDDDVAIMVDNRLCWCYIHFSADIKLWFNLFMMKLYLIWVDVHSRRKACQSQQLDAKVFHLPRFVASVVS